MFIELVVDLCRQISIQADIVKKKLPFCIRFYVRKKYCTRMKIFILVFVTYIVPITFYVNSYVEYVRYHD